jgi:predicted Fe-S protein YdhL (DUF1289 family)
MVDGHHNDDNTVGDNSNRQIPSTEDNTRTILPPTPCVRICRYNPNFYDGQVCIGCFREAFDIGTWASFDSTERLYALEDALGRLKNDDGTAEYFEGSISQKVLEQQISAYRRKVKDDTSTSSDY